MKYIKIILFILTMTIYHSYSDNNEEEKKKIQEYIENIIKNNDIIFNSKTPNQEKIISIGNILKKHLDLQWISKYVLGQHRNKLLKEEVNKFTEVYSKYLITKLTNLLIKYSKEKFIIYKIQKIDNTFYSVLIDITQPKFNNVIRIEYIIRNINSVYLISDIIYEGISIINNHRTEFNNIINNNGIKFLIKELNKKTTEINFAMIYKVHNLKKAQEFLTLTKNNNITLTNVAGSSRYYGMRVLDYIFYSLKKEFSSKIKNIIVDVKGDYPSFITAKKLGYTNILY